MIEKPADPFSGDRLGMRGGNVLARLAAVLLATAAASKADVRPAPIFSDGMVLQRDKPVLVWGMAPPNKAIIVSYDNQTKRTTSDAQVCFRFDTCGDPTGDIARVDSINAILRVTSENMPPEKSPSPVPKQVFPANLSEQEAALKTNTLMLRFAASRKKLSADRHRPAYHFVSPESTLNDPNGLCFWQGRWHLFYQAYPPEDRRQHWGHTVSDDLVHWQDLPYAIYPGIERMCFSGSTVVEPQQVVAFYPGIDAGQMVAIAKDPLLLNWEKIRGNPVTRPGQPMGDSCIWKQDDAYYGLIGSRCLMTSTNLVDWRVANGSFLEGPAFPIDDGSCPNFQPIGDKHILLLFSHSRGGQYLLGDYDRRKLVFRPYEHGRFNHGNVAPAGVHAPSAAADGKGKVINILNINEGKPAREWDHLFSLAQELSLGPDKRLGVAPVAAAASLRDRHQHVGQTALPANQEVVLKEIQGDTLELDLEIDPQSSRWVQLQVLRSPNAEEQTSITFYNYPDRVNTWYRAPSRLAMDNSRSSTLPEARARPPEQFVLEKGNEPLRLRVFVDRSVVEVFANDRRYLAMRVYPGRRDSLGVSLRAQGQDAVLKSLDAWQMKSIYE